MHKGKKTGNGVLEDHHITAARNLAKDAVIRAYFARRQREREGLRGRIRSLFSGKKRAKTPVVDIFDHIGAGPKK